MSKKATKRATRSGADERAVANGCYYDEGAAAHVVSFFEEHLRLTKGRWAGKPFILMDWAREDVLEPMFGWMREDGSRRFRLAYIEVPKKNSKSTMCAGIALYLLAGDAEPSAEVYCCAADRNQAGIVYRHASAMAKASPLLKPYIVPRDSIKNLAIPSSDSFLRVLSADSYTAEGIDAHGVVFDELHTQKNRALWDCLRYSGAARRQPLIVAITTAGWDRESICYKQHTRAMQVLEGSIQDDSFFAYVRSADKGDDWTSPKVWKKANPALGDIISIDDMTRECEEARESLSNENAFRRYRLCQWTEQEHRWLSMDKWNACGEPFDIEALKGRKCYGGLDLSTTTDLSALVLLFPPDIGEPDYKLLSWFWAPRDRAELRARTDRAPYLEWGQAGLLTLTDGEVTDYDVIRRDINAIADTYGIEELAVDRLFQGAQLCTQLTADGLNLAAHGMGFLSMAAPTVAFERLVLAGMLRHGGNPILRWMASNVTVETDAAGNIKPSKAKSQERIDGITAAVMAVGLADLVIEKPSVYEERGVLTI